MFAKNMQYLRSRRDLTQKQLADALFVSDKTVSKWENGMTEPNLEMLKNIGTFFEVSIDDLLGKDLSMVDMTQKTKSRFSNDIKKIFAINMALIVGYLVSLALYVGLSDDKYDYLGQGSVYVGILFYFIIAFLCWIFLYIIFSSMWKNIDKTNLVERKSFFKALFLSIALFLYTACNTIFGEHNIYNLTNRIQFYIWLTMFCALLIVLICSECYMNFVYKDKIVKNCTIYTVMQTLTAVVFIPLALYYYSQTSGVDINSPNITQSILDEVYTYQMYTLVLEVMLGVLLVVLPLVYWLIRDRKFNGICLAHTIKNFVSYMTLSAVSFVAYDVYVEEKLIWICLPVFLLNLIYYIVVFKLHKKRYSLD